MADVASTLSQWSNTASSNSPGDGTSVGSGLGDNLRTIQAVVRGYLAHYNSAAITSASTTDLGANTGLFQEISGTATITGLGTVSAGVWKVVRFQDAATLTYNGTSLILPGGVDIVTAAGDVMLAYSKGSGNWTVPFYQRLTGVPLFTSSTIAAISEDTGPDWTTDFMLSYDNSATSLKKIKVQTIIPTGMTMIWWSATPPTGWLGLDGQTIGDATSGASVASASMADLFAYWWNNLDDAYAPVSSGRGASAAADFAAHKTLTQPDGRGRSIISAGSSTSVDTFGDADVTVASSSIAVPSNTYKWITGMRVTFTLTSGTITGLTSGNQYYVVRINSTTIKLAGTLEDAQNGDFTAFSAKSSPVGNIAYSLTSHTIGSNLGAETKAMTSTELLKHSHNYFTGSGSSGATSNGTNFTIPTSTTGGNQAMAIMNPFLVGGRWIVKI